MTAESFSPHKISFKECRDEEIAGFFANGGKRFHPVLPSCKEAAQSRVVGSPHFAVKGKKGERKASARFASTGTVPSIQLCRSTLDGTIGDDSRHSPLSKPALALGTLLETGNSARQRSRAAKVVCDPLEDKPALRLSQAQKAQVQKTISVLTDSNVNKVSLQRHKPKTSNTGKNAENNAENNTAQKTPQLHSAVVSETVPENSVQESLLDRLEIADTQLQILVNSWSRIPDRFKETIRALVEVSSKDTGAEVPANSAK